MSKKGMPGNEELVELIWKTYDENKDNKLQKEEVKNLLKHLLGKKKNLNDNAINKIIEEMDKNKDGIIDKQELLQMINELDKK